MLVSPRVGRLSLSSVRECDEPGEMVGRADAPFRIDRGSDTHGRVTVWR